jgi:hypothetical protein
MCARQLELLLIRANRDRAALRELPESSGDR